MTQSLLLHEILWKLGSRQLRLARWEQASEKVQPWQCCVVGTNYEHNLDKPDQLAKHRPRLNLARDCRQRQQTDGGNCCTVDIFSGFLAPAASSS